MSLPHEAEVIADIAAKYRTELDAMAGLHDAVIGMMSAGSWTIGKAGLNRPVLETMATIWLGFLTKLKPMISWRSCRSIRNTAQRFVVRIGITATKYSSTRT